jgi:hypothetical protein
MFPQLRERLGPALDLLVEFSTLGEFRLGADGVVCPASALNPDSRRHPAEPVAQRCSPECEPQMGGAGAPNAERAAVRRNVAGGAAGVRPAATPAAGRRRADCERRPTALEQPCLEA